MLTSILEFNMIEKKFIKTINKIKQYPSLTIGGLGFGLLCLAVLLAPSLVHVDPLTINYMAILEPPSRAHLMGTDELGRDVFSRVLYGGRISLAIGAAVAVLTGIIGAAIGLICGYFSKIDFVLMRLMDVLMAFPSLLLGLAMMAALGFSAFNVVIALSLAYIPRTVRVVRSVALATRQQNFIEAAKALGASAPRILFRHMLPAAVPVLVVQQTFIFAYAVLGEAMLSFAGVGIQPPTPTLGNIIGDAQPFMQNAPWIVFFAGGVIMAYVLFLNLLGDGLREIVDPKRRYARI